MKWYSGPYVERLQKQLIELCTSKNFLGGQLYDIDELKECWSKSAPEYMVNAVPEIAKYPTVSIAWAMFYGMGAAKMWDTDWEKAKAVPDLYTHLRDVRGFDCMDEHILEDILELKNNPTRQQELTRLAQECAELALSLIRKEGIAPQSVEAFQMFAKTTEIMFNIGVSVTLYALGYRYHKVDMNLN